MMRYIGGCSQGYLKVANSSFRNLRRFATLGDDRFEGFFRCVMEARFGRTLPWATPESLNFLYTSTCYIRLQLLLLLPSHPCPLATLHPTPSIRYQPDEKI